MATKRLAAALVAVALALALAVPAMATAEAKDKGNHKRKSAKKFQVWSSTTAQGWASAGIQVKGDRKVRVRVKPKQRKAWTELNWRVSCSTNDDYVAETEEGSVSHRGGFTLRLPPTIDDSGLCRYVATATSKTDFFGKFTLQFLVRKTKN